MKRVIVLILLAFICTGCGKDESDTAYKVYYKDSSGYKLVEQAYRTDRTDVTELAKELYSQMNTRQRKSDYEIIKPDKVVLDNLVVQDSVAYLYFNNEYLRMTRVEEVLYRAALVKTLTQIDGIDYVSIYQGGLPIKYSNGNTIGLMGASDFVDDADSDISNLQWSDLKLYFANTSGDRLVAQTVSVAYSKSVSVEKVIVEQLITGPEGSGCKATLPTDLKLLGISVKNEVCYVNFSSQLLSSIANVSAEVTIYSIVNSLCELGHISTVVISVEGESAVMFRDKINLEMQLSAKPELIEASDKK